MMGNVTASVGVVSSTVFIVQIAVQVKVYGIRTWFHWGLGTGVRPEEAKHVEGEVRRLESEAKKCVDKCLSDIEEWL